MKRAVYSLIVLLMLAGAAFAAQQPPVYPTAYWVVGNLSQNNGQPADVSGYTVVVYGTSGYDNIDQAYAQAVSDANGNFAINVFDDFRLDPLFGGSYYMAVYQKNGYGKDEFPVQLRYKGFTKVDIELAEGEGPEPGPEELTEGAVILTITRDRDDINVAWEINTADYPQLTGNEAVDIYYIAGGDEFDTGQYRSDVFARMLIENDALAAGAPNEVELGNKTFKWKDQVGMGLPELYFKGCITGQSTDAELGLAKAVAVGKLDVALADDYNFVSMPFLLSGDDLTNAFSSQLNITDVEIYSFDEARGVLAKAKYKNTGWDFPGTSFGIVMGKSYWVRMTAAKRVSLLGKVTNAAFTKTMLAARYLVLGNPVPISLVFDDVLPADGTNEIYWFHNDSKTLEKMKNTNGTWVNAAPGQPVYRFTPGAGYWYRNKGSEYDWTLPSQ